MFDGTNSEQPVTDSPDASVVQAELAPPMLPAPGFWASVGCCVLLLGAQMAVVTAVLIPWAFLEGIRGGGPLDPAALQDSLPMTLLIGAGTVGTVLCALLIVAIAYRRQVAAKLALRNPTFTQWAVVVLAVLPLSVLSSELTNWVAWVLPNSWTEMGEIFAQFAEESLGAALFFGAILAALGEELCFRGFIGRGLVARYGVVAGVLLTSFLFGAVHFNPVQASGAMLLGIGIHGIYLATRSLYLPILAHALNNALAFVAFSARSRLSLPGYIPDEQGTVEFTPWLLLLMSAAAVMGLTLVLRDTRTRFLFANGSIWDPGFVTAEQPPRDVPASPHTSPAQPLSLLIAALTYGGFFVTLLFYTRWSG